MQITGAMGGDTTRSGNGIGRQAEFVHAQARGARGWLAWRLGVVGTHMYVHVHVCGARTHNTHMCACKMPLTLAFVAAVKVVLRRQKAANPRWWRSRTSMCKLPFNPRGKQNQAGGSWDGPIPGCSILMRAPNMHGQSGATGVCACVRWKDPVFWVSAKRDGNKCCVARNSVLCWQGRKDRVPRPSRPKPFASALDECLGREGLMGMREGWLCGGGSGVGGCAKKGETRAEV